MLWLITIISAYLFLGLAAFGDKLFLKDKEKPQTYVFYVGVLSGLVVFLIPFVNFSLPPLSVLIWPIIEGIVYILALYFLYLSLSKYEVSQIVPAIGGIQPIFIFIFTILIYGTGIFVFKDVLALVILTIGTILISLDYKTKKINKISLGYAFLVALLFALDYMLTKQVFLLQDFWSGLILMRISSFILVLFFLFNYKFRKNLFKKKTKNKGVVFLLAQGSGGIGILLQSYAISLVPVVYLATLNALKGVQYIFLIALTMVITKFFPKILKETFDRKTLFLKIISVLTIALGIALLVI